MYLANDQYAVDLKLELTLGSEEKRAGSVFFCDISLNRCLQKCCGVVVFNPSAG